MARAFFVTSETGGRAGKAVSDKVRDICVKLGADDYDISPYSQDIRSICIVVCCFPDELRAVGFGKVRKLIKYQEGSADIRLPMPYADFVNADDEMRYLMVVKTITEAVAVIEERCKKSRRAVFDGKGMNEDILQKLEVDKEKLDGIVGCMD